MVDQALIFRKRADLEKYLHHIREFQHICLEQKGKPWNSPKTS